MHTDTQEGLRVHMQTQQKAEFLFQLNFNSFYCAQFEVTIMDGLYATFQRLYSSIARSWDRKMTFKSSLNASLDPLSKA